MGNNFNENNTPDVNEIKSLIDELLDMQSKFNQPDNIPAYDENLSPAQNTLRYLDSVGIHQKKIKSNVEKIDKKLTEYSPLLKTTLGKLITEITNQIRHAHPDLDVTPKCKTFGRYRKMQNPPVGLLIRGYSHQFHGRVKAFIEIENMPSIDLGFVHDFFEICQKRPFTPEGKLVERPLKNYNIGKLADTSMDTLQFLTQNSEHPCKELIDKACYNIIDENIQANSPADNPEI